MTTGAEFAGGTPNHLGSAVSPEIPHPLVAEQAYTDYLLTLASEYWAAGPASAEWHNWPAATEVPADTALPGLVRVGTTERGEPYLTPLLGESHILIGDPHLLQPTVRPALNVPR